MFVHFQRESGKAINIMPGSIAEKFETLLPCPGEYGRIRLQGLIPEDKQAKIKTRKKTTRREARSTPTQVAALTPAANSTPIPEGDEEIKKVRATTPEPTPMANSMPIPEGGEDERDVQQQNKDVQAQKSCESTPTAASKLGTLPTPRTHMKIRRAADAYTRKVLLSKIQEKLKELDKDLLTEEKQCADKVAAAAKIHEGRIAEEEELAARLNKLHLWTACPKEEPEVVTVFAIEGTDTVSAAPTLECPCPAFTKCLTCGSGEAVDTLTCQSDHSDTGSESDSEESTSDSDTEPEGKTFFFQTENINLPTYEEYFVELIKDRYAEDEKAKRASVLAAQQEYTKANSSGGGDQVDLRRYGILDSGANHHCVSKHIPLLNKRTKRIWIQNASGGRAMYDQSGDFVIACRDQNGQELEPLLVREATVIPNSSFNLLSISLLCERGVSFTFRKRSEGGSHLTYNVINYPIIERNGLY